MSTDRETGEGGNCHGALEIEVFGFKFEVALIGIESPSLSMPIPRWLET